MSTVTSPDRPNGSFRVMLPSWINSIWIYFFGKRQAVPAQAAVTAPIAEQNGRDEFGRVEFAMPGFGTC